MLNFADKLGEHVSKDTILQEVKAATDYAKTNTKRYMTPLENSAKTLSPKQIKTNVANLGAAGGQCLFGGTLGMLDWDSRVKEMTDLNLSKMRWALQQYDCNQDLNKMLGTIVVCAEHIDDKPENAVVQSLRRAERDAEIDAVALVLYWSNVFAEPQKELCVTIAAQICNVVYSAEMVGVGADRDVERFSRVEEEETPCPYKRTVRTPL